MAASTCAARRTCSASARSDPWCRFATGTPDSPVENRRHEACVMRPPARQSATHKLGHIEADRRRKTHDIQRLRIPPDVPDFSPRRLVLTVLLCLTVALSAPAQEAKDAPKGLRIFVCGHSFHMQTAPGLAG